MAESKMKSPLEALEHIVDAWEKLPGGRNYPPYEIEQWLSRTMAPAINEARATLGRPTPAVEK